jgi:hypothetical protein
LCSVSHDTDRFRAVALGLAVAQSQFVPRTLDDHALTAVFGGASSNIDYHQFRWQPVGEDAAIPVTTNFSARTPYGSCVDQAFKACDTGGGGNAKIGQCKLTAADACWTKNK